MKRALWLALLAGACAPLQTQPQATADLHSRMLTLDAHLDTPAHFSRSGWSFGDRHNLATDLVQVDMGRMEEGALDGGFFVIYTAQGPLTAEGYSAAREFALKRSDEIDATLARFPNRISAAKTARDAERLASERKLIAFKSIENSYPLGEDLSLLSEFYRRGIRLAGPVHSSNNQFADSATDTPRWHGLSPLGRQWVAEMNRLGIVIDGSHASDAAFDQMLALSKTPLLLSHSGSKTVHDHPRNIDDNRIRALAASGGAICVTTVFLSNMNLSQERGELFGQWGRIGELTPAEQVELARRWNALDQRERLWSADFEDFMKALLHVIEVAGVDHVCMGADWDGGGGLPGIEDISSFPKVTERLIQAGYSPADIEKIWSGNILRILRAAESAAK
jgi:membrane dipeptidase